VIYLDIWEDDLPEEVMERVAGKLCELGVLIKKTEQSTDEDSFVVTRYEFKLAEILPEKSGS
jgi:hypothetical protein